MDTNQTSTEQNYGCTDYNGKKYAQHHIQRQKEQHLDQAEDTDTISNVRHMKWSRTGYINRLKDLAVRQEKTTR